MLSSVRKPPPQVTGISPKEGPPGTRVTLRGENLGTDARDLIGLRICGMDCLMTAEWKSPNKIIARTGQAKGKGDIIVVTRSGGVGTCTVVFRGYYIQTGPLQESAIWIDETQTYATMFGRSRATSPVTSQTHDDPLGLSDEASDTRFPERDLLEMFPEGSGDSSLDNFVPAWYLLENHHGTSFDDLKAGLAFLKRKSGQRDEGPMAFVKANLSSFMDCYDTLAEVHSKVADDRTNNPGGCITEALEDVLLRANNAAEDLFQDVLRRKDRADATRNALGVLHRFKWLFNLPHTIDTNIKKGDYDLVITDFTRAKSLFGDTEVAIFKKVYNEVEKRIAAFRTMLYRKLMELPLLLEEQKKVIRYLVHLETRGDPAWECLVNMQQWLANLLIDCKDQHLTKEHQQQESAGKDGSKMDSTDDSESGLTTTQLTTTQLGRTPSFKSGSKPPQKVLFVDHLTRLLLDTLPDLWRLGQSYFSGKLLKEVKKSKHVDTAKQNKFKQMILDIISLFCNLDRAACLPISLDKLPPKERERFGSWSDWKGSPVSWLPICMRYNRSCMLALSGLDLPNEATELLQQLVFDMRSHCMTRLLEQAISDIKALHDREMWLIDTNDESGATTLLPALFENIVSETVQHLEEIIKPKGGEEKLFSQPEIQERAARLTVELLQSFAGTLEQLAMLGNVEKPTDNRRSAMAPDQFVGGGTDGMPSLDKRLLVMTGNCSYTRNDILPRLVELLNKHGYPQLEEVRNAVVECYEALDERLFVNYIEEKANPIIGSLEQNMYTGKFDWGKCLRPTGVGNYLKEAVMGIIQVHAEVYSISPNFVSRILFYIIEAVVEEIVRLMQCVTNFSAHGVVQASLELMALDRAIGVYKTEHTVAALKEGLDGIPQIKTTEDIKLVHDLLDQFQSHMKFQLLCFKTDPNIKLSPGT